MSAGVISGIKRFEIHDGDGIRTTVFLKGCPLRCRWCHNPENLSSAPQIMFYADKCLGCRSCEQVCACHAPAAPKIDRARCSACGRCVSHCPSGALEVSGRRAEAEELLPLLVEDRMFFEASSGGVTLSGGEPLMQPVFAGELLRLLKNAGIHTALDTCLFAFRSALEGAVPWTDQFLIDVKAIDSEVHRRCTGVDNAQILSNLRRLDEMGKSIEIRVPFIPGWNDGEMEAIAQFLAGLQGRYRIRLLPYHDYGNAKAARLDMEMESIALPNPQAVAQALETFRRLGLDAFNGAAED